METLLYFAYGSNMLWQRLQTRCPSATFITTGRADGYRLQFAKTSVDGSGKATVMLADGATVAKVYGCLFEIRKDEFETLDQIEGYPDHYDRDNNFAVLTPGSRAPSVTRTYIARSDKIDPAKKPYHWYHALVVAGARQNQLPEDYISGLEKVETMRDPQPGRQRYQEALAVLEQAGYPMEI